MPLQPGDITNVQISQGSITAEDGRILRVKNVSFKVRGQGPFSVQVPAADFSAEAAEALVKQEAAEVVLIMEIT